MAILLLINLVVTVLVIRYFFRLAKTRSGILGIAGLSLVSAVVLSGFSMALAMQMALTFVLAIIALSFPPNGIVIKTALIIAPMFSYVAALRLTYPELRERAALRYDFPLVSLADRLQYEVKSDAQATTTAADLALPDDLDRRLREVESHGDRNSRTYMLSSLHDRTSDDFVMAKGFGPIRMRSAHRDRITLPNLAPIPYEPAPTRHDSRFQANGSTTDSADDSPARRTPLSTIELKNMHNDSFDSFLLPERMGYIQDREHVAGFQSHRFDRMPGTEWMYWRDHPSDEARKSPAAREAWRKKWAIVRIELIGLLSHSEPLAYISEHLPQLDELATYQIRALTEFEQLALEQLRSNEDLVIDDQSDRIRMVGSLRAGKNCQKCHTVQRGALLGALSYEMLPE